MTEKTPDTTDREPPRFEVKLIKPHTHAGEDREPGETIKVTAAQRDWLREAEVIEPSPAETSEEK